MLPRYGVLIGTYDHSGAHQGQWLRELLYVRAGGQLYECAVDVNEPTGTFQYMLRGSLDAGIFTRVSSLTDGYHPLAPDPTSGAIDYIRSPLVRRSEGCVALSLTVFNNLLGRNDAIWHTVIGDEAGNALVGIVTGSQRVYVFGTPYGDPVSMPGMRAVHMNQGDPVDGIWQDGCVIVTTGDGKLSGYFGKFATQSLRPIVPRGGDQPTAKDDHRSEVAGGS